MIGPLEALKVEGLIAHRCRWSRGEPPTGIQMVTTQIRYRHKGISAHLIARGDSVEVYFHEPQSAVTPGQAVVFYKGDRVLGGGWIEEALSETPETSTHSPFDVR